MELILLIFIVSNSSYPIYLTLGNLPLDLQFLEDAKVVVGFIPKIPEELLNEIAIPLRGYCNALLWHRCLKILLKPLVENETSNIVNFLKLF